MDVLQKKRQTIMDRLNTLRAEHPGLVAALESAKQRRLDALTEAMLSGAEAATADLDAELTAAERAVSDNKAITASLEARLVETERAIRLQEAGKAEAEYLQVLDKLDELPGEMEIAFTGVVTAIATLEGLAKLYWSTRQKRQMLAAGFRAALQAEGATELSPRIGLANLDQDDQHCQGLDSRIIANDGAVVELIRARRLEACSSGVAFFR